MEKRQPSAFFTQQHARHLSRTHALSATLLWCLAYRWFRRNLGSICVVRRERGVRRRATSGFEARPCAPPPTPFLSLPAPPPLPSLTHPLARGVLVLLGLLDAVAVGLVRLVVGGVVLGLGHGCSGCAGVWRGGGRGVEVSEGGAGGRGEESESRSSPSVWGAKQRLAAAGIHHAARGWRRDGRLTAFRTGRVGEAGPPVGGRGARPSPRPLPAAARSPRRNFSSRGQQARGPPAARSTSAQEGRVYLLAGLLGRGRGALALHGRSWREHAGYGKKATRRAGGVSALGSRARGRRPP